MTPEEKEPRCKEPDEELERISDIHILIDDGSMFDGSLGQFRDCFFSNATPTLIFDWARDNGYSCIIRNRP